MKMERFRIKKLGAQRMVKFVYVMVFLVGTWCTLATYTFIQPPFITLENLSVNTEGNSIEVRPPKHVEMENLSNQIAGLNRYERLNLVAGELPGYTGWPRSEKTLVSHYHRQDDGQNNRNSPINIESGKRLSFNIQCELDECRDGGAHFYLRAYGPSVITGEVIDYENGSYTMSFYPVDPGMYTVEIVLSFCCTNDWRSFPPENKYGGNNELNYEGYLIHGFPQQVHVYPSKQDDDSTKPICSIAQLVETNTNATNFLQKGRWAVSDLIRSGVHKLKSSSPNDISFEGFQEGTNSIGISMEYTWNDCSLLPLDFIVKKQNERKPILEQCLSNISNNKRKDDVLRVIFIGDSVMKLEEKNFVEKILKKTKSKNIKFRYISSNDGILLRNKDIIQELERLKKDKPNERRVIYFNSGLHDSGELFCYFIFKYRLCNINVMTNLIFGREYFGS